MENDGARVEPILCKTCNKRFKFLSGLLRHQKTCGNPTLKWFKCCVCSMSFGRKDNLNRHMMSTHKDESEIRTPKKNLLKDSNLSDGNENDDEGAPDRAALDGKKGRKKQGVRLKETEIKSFVSQVQEKSLTVSSFEKVHDILPTTVSYVVTDCTETESESKWTATMRADISAKEGAMDWLSEFEKMNSLDFRVLKTKKENSNKLVMKREYRCHHRTIPRERDEISLKHPGTRKIHTGVNSGYYLFPEGKTKIFSNKNTNCPAFIKITIKQKCMKWSSDMLLQEYPCEITIKHQHNHPVHAADVLRRRRPTEAVKQKFIEMFHKGHSPLSALECHKFDLMSEHGDNYYIAAADGSVCPSNFWAYKLHSKLCIERYGPQCGDAMRKKLIAFCEEFNSKTESLCCKVDSEGDHLIIAVCTPLMKRVHRLLGSSAEVMLVDSSGTMDCMNCQVFPLLTTSVAGGLPLGIVITTSEGEPVLKKALHVWTSLLPKDAFFGKGPSTGPKIIMTDDSSAERNALQSTFLNSVLLLCIFHVLQAFWRFIWNRESDVPKESRSELFFLFKDLVYAKSEEEFQDRLKDAMENERLSKAPKVKLHLQKLIPRFEEWALFVRRDLLTRGNNTNNYSEANMRILKDKMLGRLKAFNPVQLLDFLLTRYNTYLVNRIIDVINNRSSNPFKSRFFIRPEKLVDLECVCVPSTPNTYKVVNKRKNTEYIVVMDYEICSCEAGQSGSSCKHLCKVVQHFNLSSSHIHPLLQCNEKHKKELFEIAHGHCNVPSEWFAGLFADTSKLSTQQDSGENIVIEETSSDVVQEQDKQCDMVNTSQSVELIQNTLDELKEIFESYSNMLKADPASCHEGFKAFIKQNKLLLNSQSGVISALHNFGKTPSLPLSGGNIPVHATTIARRTTYLGGKQRQFTGRPPNAMGSANSSEHSYVSSAKKRSHEEPVWHSLPTKVKSQAPHSLQLCVETTRMVGKKH